MAILELQDVPEHLLVRLEGLALQKRVSVSEEAIQLLHEALSKEEDSARHSHAAALAELRRNRWAPPPGLPDSVELIREDRDR